MDGVQTPAPRRDRVARFADPRLAFRVPHDDFPVVTDPVFAEAADADFMRADDWVLGLRVGDVARCYPAWMLDNCHVVNDTIDGEHYAVAHCEICCSNAAFVTQRGDRRLTFGTGGLFGGTLALYDEQTGSLWSHGMGVAFDGPLAGTVLERVESFQATYAEWLALHPGTEVMVWPAPPAHPDARHGHGTDATFAQAGIEPLVLRTMAVREDARLAENEIVITLFTPDGDVALPLETLHRAGGLVRTTVGAHDLVTLSASPDSALTGTYHTHLADEPESEVRLTRQQSRVVDEQTGSEFRVDGLAISGPLAGRRLRALPTMTNKWHSLTCFIPDIPVVEAEAPPSPVAEADLAPAFDVLRRTGYRIETRRRLYALEIPHEARCGFAVEIDGEPFTALLFSHESIAADELLWRSHAVSAGALLFVSTPARYRDWTNTRVVADGDVAWSTLPDDPRFQHALRRAGAADPTFTDVAPTCLTHLLSALPASGFPCRVDRACYRDSLPPHALAGVRVEIAGDPFIVHRFASEAEARRAATPAFQALVAGHFVLRSDPANVYADRERGTRRRADEAISWSRLLTSAAFESAVRAAARREEGRKA
jgi:hypothetical protein